MTDKPRYEIQSRVNRLKNRPKDSSPETLAAVDAAGERAGFNVRQTEAREASKVGRPRKARTEDEARLSFGLDRETHQLFKIWLLKNGLTMQDHLENHIKSLVKSENL